MLQVEVEIISATRCCTRCKRTTKNRPIRGGHVRQSKPAKNRQWHLGHRPRRLGSIRTIQDIKRGGRRRRADYYSSSSPSSPKTSSAITSPSCFSSAETRRVSLRTVAFSFLTSSTSSSRLTPCERRSEELGGSEHASLRSQILVTRRWNLLEERWLRSGQLLTERRTSWPTLTLLTEHAGACWISW